jgi:uncharacterized protein YkwD
MTLRIRALPPFALLVSVALAAGLVVTTAGFAAPTSAANSGATTSSTSTALNSVESSILTSLNRDRAARGLRPLRLDLRLADLAGTRAARMASKNTLSHTAAGGDFGPLLYSLLGVPSWSWGEDIGWTGYPYGSQAASSLYSMWRQSSTHWALMMSSRMNYIGVGVAYRSSNHTTWASLVFTESADHTRPVARMTGDGRSGTTISFSWYGADRPLQSHTAGLKNFDVQYRVDSGSWRLIRSGTTARSITLSGRARHHTYYLRVQARDNRGNLSGYTTSLHVSVP